MLRKLLHLFCGTEKFCKESFISNSHIVIDRCCHSFMFIVNKISVTDQIRKIYLYMYKQNNFISLQYRTNCIPTA